MDCRTCAYAKWRTTKNGRLHPSGEGKCVCPIKMPELPKAYYWPSLATPSPNGGFIDRHKPERYVGCQRWMRLPRTT